MAVKVCGRHGHGLWPSLLWPSWSILWPSWFVAVIVEPIIHDWLCLLSVAALNNNKTVSADRDDGIYDREHCDRYIDDGGTVASVVSEQLCYPVLSSYSPGLTASYDHSPQLASLAYLQQVR